MTISHYHRRRLARLLFSLPTIIRFNYHYLPFKQAVKLPIWLKKADLVSMKGTVRIEAEKISMGMIQLGYRDTSIYPNDGIMWENKGADVVFRGKCRIGNHSFLSMGEGASVVFGDDFRNSGAMKLVANHKVIFGRTVSVGWETLIMDDNLHPLYDTVKQEYKPSGGDILIGDYNWLATGCKVLHGVKTPERCIFSAGSLITRGSEMRSQCVMGGQPLRVISENVIRDFDAE